MSKKILTKKQAISVLNQIAKKEPIDIFEPVDINHSFFKLSCEELEKKLWQYVSEEEVIAVVEEV